MAAAMLAPQYRRFTSPLGTLPLMYAFSSGGALALSAEDRRPWETAADFGTEAFGRADGAGGGALPAVLSKPACTETI